MSVKTFFYQVVYPASLEAMLAKQISVKSFQDSAKPIIKFKISDTNQPTEILEGHTYTFDARFLYILPLGKYKIHFIEINNRHFLSKSSCLLFKEIKHWVDFTAKDDNKTMCTHQIEINAGWFTPVIYFFTKIYHWNKKRKLNKLLKEQEKSNG